MSFFTEKISVTPQDLQERLGDGSLVLLDATMPVIGAESVGEEKAIIPGALRMDIDTEFSDSNAIYPHTMLSTEKFTEKVQALGINSDSVIVVYDDVGIFSAPRAWWMFKAMGHDNVTILNGGLNVWLSAGMTVESQYRKNITNGDFQADPQAGYFSSIEDVKNAIAQNTLILDARNADRFNSRVDEPRSNLRRGNIPSSRNLPFQSLVNEQGYLPQKQLNSYFDELSIDKDQKIIFSCGSGITASIDAVAAKVCGFTNVSVYDGSWCEWGSLIAP